MLLPLEVTTCPTYAWETLCLLNKYQKLDNILMILLLFLMHFSFECKVVPIDFSCKYDLSSCDASLSSLVSFDYNPLAVSLVSIT
jgi:hypothetical protein